MPVIDIIQNALASLTGAETSLADRLHHVIKTLSPLGIKANYDPVAPGDVPSRVLFYSSRYNARNFATAAECNGIIFDYRTWQVLYRPPELPNAQFSATRVAENFADYDVFELYDGTVVGFYHYRGEWHIATARGLSMAGLTWRGVTYRDAIEAAMQVAKFPDAAGQARALTWSELDPDVSYTLGFTHPGMHYSKHLGIWLIRARTRDGEAVPLAQFEMPVQLDVTGRFATFNDLQTVCKNRDVSNWGYILRSRVPERTGADSTVIIESRHMNLVRTLVYDRNIMQNALLHGVTEQQFTFANSLLSQNMRENYLWLYPEHAARQAAAMQAIDLLASDVMQPTKKEAAGWYRAHLQRLMPTACGRGQACTRMCANMHAYTRTQVMDYIFNRSNINVLIKFLQREAQLPE